MNKLVTLSALIGLLLSCNQKTKEQLQIEEAMVIYNQNAKVVHPALTQTQGHGFKKKVFYLEVLA